MKVLLTGYTGFLGRHIARALKQHGHMVRVILHKHTVARMDFKAEADELLWGSLEDHHLREKALAGVDVVIHSAWSFNRETAVRPTANEVIAEQLFKESIKIGVKSFAFISSVVVYGMKFDKSRIIDENSGYCLNPANFIYPSEKIATENILMNIVHDKIKLGIFRPGPIFDNNKGPFKIKVGNIAIGIGNGRNPMPLIHAADVAEAIILWFNNGKNDSVYNITPSECLKKREWYAIWGINNGLNLNTIFLPIWFWRLAAAITNLLKKTLGKPEKINIKYALSVANRCLQYSNARLTQELGWQPIYTDRFVTDRNNTQNSKLKNESSALMKLNSRKSKNG